MGVESLLVVSPKPVLQIKVHCKTLKAEPLDDWHELGEELGHLRLKCQKIQRTEDVDNEGDEQAIMNALQKHAGDADAVTTVRT